MIEYFKLTTPTEYMHTEVATIKCLLAFEVSEQATESSEYIRRTRQLPACITMIPVTEFYKQMFLFLI